MEEIDTEKVICRLSELQDDGCREFKVGQKVDEGDWPLRGFVVRVRGDVHAYVNHCPHAGHRLNLRPNQFLTHDASMIICSSHGALFEKRTGYCVAGPCAGRSLKSLPLRIVDGLVLLDET